MGRRGFLSLGAAGLALPFLTRLSAFASPAPLPPDRCLSFYNTHTGESVAIDYCRSGCFVPASLDKINHILRDHRTGEIKGIDVRLLDLLTRLSGEIPTAEPFQSFPAIGRPKRTASQDARHGGPPKEPPSPRSGHRHPRPRP